MDSKCTTSEDKIDETTNDDENEYQLAIDFASLHFTDEAIQKAQIILLYGDLMSKIEVYKKIMNSDESIWEEEPHDEKKGNDDDDFQIDKKIYIVHATPTDFADKLLNMRIVFTILTEQQEILGKLSIPIFDRLLII